MYGRRWRWIAVPCLLAMLAGCSREYGITQFDNEPSVGFDAKQYHRAAIVTHQGEDEEGNRQPGYYDANRLFLEAFQVELMKRGFEVVEREKFTKLVNEQMLVRGEMANLSDREKAMRLGKMMNVDVVFYADALINRSRYTYDPPPFVSRARALAEQTKANESGVVEGVGFYTIYAYHDVGATVRAIDARTGEIVWVGYRMLAVCEEVTKKSPTALTSFSAIKDLCGSVLDDFYSPKSPTKSRKG